jgi:hypothetical protein
MHGDFEPVFSKAAYPFNSGASIDMWIAYVQAAIVLD